MRSTIVRSPSASTRPRTDVGGSVGGTVPAVLWDRGGWPACVGFVLSVEAAMLAIAWKFWTRPDRLPDWPAATGS